MQHSQLKLSDRQIIDTLIKNKKTKAEIARIIGCHRSTICREIKRNSVSRSYRAATANFLYLTRRRANAVKKLDDPKLAKFVLKRLMFRWSPEQIAGRLKTFADSGFHVSTETIYKWIYALASKGAPLFMYLRTLEKPRKRRRGKDKRRKPCKNKNN